MTCVSPAALNGPSPACQQRSCACTSPVEDRRSRLVARHASAHFYVCHCSSGNRAVARAEHFKVVSDDHSLPLVAFQLTTTKDGKERGYTACVLPLLHEQNFEGHPGHGCYVICDVQHDGTDRKERDYFACVPLHCKPCQVPVGGLPQCCETTPPHSPTAPHSLSKPRTCQTASAATAAAGSKSRTGCKSGAGSRAAAPRTQHEHMNMSIPGSENY